MGNRFEVSSNPPEVVRLVSPDELQGWMQLGVCEGVLKKCPSGFFFRSVEQLMPGKTLYEINPLGNITLPCEVRPRDLIGDFCDKIRNIQEIERSQYVVLYYSWRWGSYVEHFRELMGYERCCVRMTFGRKRYQATPFRVQ